LSRFRRFRGRKDDFLQQEEETLRIRTLGIVMLYVCLITSGCASIGLRDTRSEENLRQRVVTFYSYREAGDYFRAFEFENMSLDGKVSAREYSGGKRVGIKNVTIGDVAISNDTAEVSIKAKILTPKLKGFDRFNTEIDYDFQDKWVFRNNNWYHVQKGQAGEW
jgi:hypothetical protein